jgi:catechol 2,3-dioxygenase-like lactoylglutathione lyase family enzyme
MPQITGVLETCLYVSDVQRSAKFYERLFGFQRMLCNERLCALSVAGRDVLILFLQGATAKPVSLPGGVLPPHLAAWEQRLAEAGVAIESRVHWESGGNSLYFRDPDGHLAELATPGTWPIY